jgi:hypothetical protein
MKSDRNKQHIAEGWDPKTAPKEEDTLIKEERSLDVGESGQFAPGGYYNQQAINEPDRSSLDDDVIPPRRR